MRLLFRLLALLSAVSAVAYIPSTFLRRGDWGVRTCNNDLHRPKTTTTTTQTTRLAAGRPDATQAIQEALRITKEKGARSAEARIAWEAVEEMDSSDASPAFLTMPALVVDGDAAAALSSGQVQGWDYAQQVSALAYLLHDTTERMGQIQTLVASLRDLELDDPALAKWDDALGAAGPLKTALQEAKAAAEVHGPTSPEAGVAWDRVEECAAEGDAECSVDTQYRYSAASLKAHHLYDAVIDSSLLREALDALGTLDGLRRSIRIEHRRLQT